MTPADRLAHWGRLLWGERWQSALALALALNLRTVQRWAAGQGEPPNGVWLELRQHAKQRIENLRRALKHSSLS